MRVGSSHGKLTKQAEEFLEAGELVVAAAKCLPRGAGKRRAAGRCFGVLGVLVVASTARAGSLVFGRPLPNHLALVVTNRRLLVFRLSEATEKVVEQTHAVPMAHIADVRSEIGKSVGMKAVYITLSFTDGSTASLEALRPNTNDGEDVARALSASAATGSVERLVPNFFSSSVWFLKGFFIAADRDLIGFTLRELVGPQERGQPCRPFGLLFLGVVMPRKDSPSLN